MDETLETLNTSCCNNGSNPIDSSYSSSNFSAPRISHDHYTDDTHHQSLLVHKKDAGEEGIGTDGRSVVNAALYGDRIQAPKDEPDSEESQYDDKIEDVTTDVDEYEGEADEQEHAENQQQLFICQQVRDQRSTGSEDPSSDQVNLKNSTGGQSTVRTDGQNGGPTSDQVNGKNSTGRQSTDGQNGGPNQITVLSRSTEGSFSGRVDQNEKWAQENSEPLPSFVRNLMTKDEALKRLVETGCVTISYLKQSIKRRTEPTVPGSSNLSITPVQQDSIKRSSTSEISPIFESSKLFPASTDWSQFPCTYKLLELATLAAKKPALEEETVRILPELLQLARTPKLIHAFSNKTRVHEGNERLTMTNGTFDSADVFINGIEESDINSYESSSADEVELDPNQFLEVSLRKNQDDEDDSENVLSSGSGSSTHTQASKQISTTLQYDEARRSHKCPHCSKGFFWPTDLKRHILRHTGERPFICNFCGANYTRKFLMQNHVKKCHEAGGLEVEFQPLKNTVIPSSESSGTTNPPSGTTAPAVASYVVTSTNTADSSVNPLKLKLTKMLPSKLNVTTKTNCHKNAEKVVIPSISPKSTTMEDGISESGIVQPNGDKECLLHESSQNNYASFESEPNLVYSMNCIGEIVKPSTPTSYSDGSSSTNLTNSEFGQRILVAAAPDKGLDLYKTTTPSKQLLCADQIHFPSIPNNPIVIGISQTPAKRRRNFLLD